jgi:hypothetical protein
MRRWLVVFLAVSAAVLSFDALRAQARASGAVHHDALAALWAVTVDGMAAAGILGVRDDRRDTRAWCMLALAFGASVAFQITTPPAWLARGVPPVALFLAFVVLELPRARGGAGAGADAPAPPPTGEPVVRLHDAPPRAPALAPVLAPADTRARAAHPAGRTYRTLTPAERRKAERELARDPEVSARQLAARTGIAYAPVRAFLRARELAPSRNGSRP